MRADDPTITYGGACPYICLSVSQPAKPPLASDVPQPSSSHECMRLQLGGPIEETS